MTDNIRIRPAERSHANDLLYTTGQSVRGLAKSSYSADQIENWLKGCTSHVYLTRIEAGCQVLHKMLLNVSKNRKNLGMHYK